MTAARKTGLLRFSASRCLALIVKEWHQIGRDPSALVIGVFLPLFMLLVCGFGISMDMKDVPVAIVLEERTPVAQRIVVDFTANPYFDAKVFYAKAPAEKALEAREVECILTIPAGFAANAQQGEAAELGLTVYGVDSNSATLFKSYVLGQLNSSVTKMVSNGMIEPAVVSRVSAARQVARVPQLVQRGEHLDLVPRTGHPRHRRGRSVHHDERHRDRARMGARHHGRDLRDAGLAP